MNLWDRVGEIVAKYGEKQLFEISSDSEGLLLTLPGDLFDQCDTGQGDPDRLNQFIHLQMLQEQGQASQIANGFLIETVDAVRLENSFRRLLQIPDPWPGKFELDISGHTTSTNFELQMILVDLLGNKIRHFKLKGPLLYLTDTEVYLPNEEQWLAFDTVLKHEEMNVQDRDEYSNLLAIYKLQKAKDAGLEIDLRQFDTLEATEPEGVSVSVNLDQDGNAELTPAFKDLSPDDVKSRLQQFNKEGQHSFRVKGKILLMDEKRLAAVQEIIKRRHIPKEHVPVFFKTPTAYLDASLVDLDMGFSLRVQGVQEFTHAYFGETDETGINWLDTHAETIFAPSKINRIIHDEETLQRFEEKVDAAWKTGASQCFFDENLFDISDKEAIQKAIIETREKITERQQETKTNDAKSDEEDKQVSVAIEIAKNDRDRDFGDEQKIDDVLYQDDPDWERYKRKPFNYQKRGIRWILGLSCHTFAIGSDDLGKFGSLLADDMGLGKTYMSLVAVNEYLKQAKDKKVEKQPGPVLVVAPLGLLDNWKDEVEKTFTESPFNSIIRLQADADLKQYRLQGAGRETVQNLNVELEEIRYALKVGKEFGVERLDLPQRLVLTTYQTLRDYQFSLARIDWSFVIFDEAQNIKNPNSLSTVAAKALKARFKLIATGTPVENSLADFWCLLDTAKPGYLGAYQHFRAKYIKPILQAEDEDKPNVRLGIGKRLRHDVGALMLRRVKEEQLHGLPKKTIFSGGRKSKYTKHMGVLYCTMTERQCQSYDTIIQIVKEQQDSGEGGNPVLSGLHRLRDVSLHPDLVEGDGLPTPTNGQNALEIINESGKLQGLIKLLYEIQERQEKVIIFVINRNLQAFLKAALGNIFERQISVINGDTKAVAKKQSDQTRRSLITDFEQEQGFNIIIMSPLAAGTGLTIVGANNVVHLERHWNPAKEAQATDRVYRIGQEKDVNVYIPVLHHPVSDVDSFDVNLDQLLSMKADLKDAVITPEEVDPQVLGNKLFDTKEPTGRTSSRVYMPDDLKNLSWQKFEALIAELLKRHYEGEVMLTKDGADKGADVVVKGIKNVLVQVKHITDGKLNSEMPLREIFAAKQPYSQATGIQFDELIVATNAKKIPSRIRNQEETYNVKLWDFNRIKDIMAQHHISEKDVLLRLGKKRLGV